MKKSLFLFFLAFVFVCNGCRKFDESVPLNSPSISFELKGDIPVYQDDTVFFSINGIGVEDILSVYAEIGEHHVTATSPVTKPSTEEGDSWEMGVFMPEFKDGKCWKPGGVVFHSVPKSGPTLLTVGMVDSNQQRYSAAITLCPNGCFKYDPPTRIDYPVMFLGSPESELYDALKKLSSDVESGFIDNLPALVAVDGKNFASYRKQIAEAFQDGLPVCVFDPDMSELNNFLDENGEVMRFDEDDEDCWLAAFSTKGGLFTMPKAIVSNGAESDEDLSLEDKGLVLQSDGLDGEGDLTYFTDFFAGWVNDGLFEKNTKVATEDKALFRSFKKAVSIPYEYTNTKIYYPGWGRDWVEVDKCRLTMDYAYEITPLYASSGNSPGDYYLVDATFNVNSKYMYKHNWEHKRRGWSTTTTMGFFLTKFTIAVTGENLGSIEFTATGSPIPESFNGSTSYSSGSNWNIGGSITGGKEAGPQHGTWWSLKPTFSFGYSRTNNEQYSLPDVVVSNIREGAMASWECKMNNLPHKGTGEGTHNGITPCPPAAKGGVCLRTHWVWYNPNSRDNQKPTGTEKIHTELTAQYDGIGTRSSVTHNDYTHEDLKGKYPITAEYKKPIDIVAPIRIPFGTISLKNTFNDLTITNISIKDSSTGVDFSDETGTQIGPGESKDFNLPVGSYKIAFDAGGRISKLVRYVYSGNNGIIKVSKRYNEKDIQSLRADFAFIPTN